MYYLGIACIVAYGFLWAMGGFTLIDYKTTEELNELPRLTSEELRHNRIAQVIFMICMFGGGFLLWAGVKLISG